MTKQFAFFGDKNRIIRLPRLQFPLRGTAAPRTPLYFVVHGLDRGRSPFRGAKACCLRNRHIRREKGTIPFSAAEVRRYTRKYERRLDIVSPDEVDEYLTRAVPLSVNSMDLVLRRGWERFVNRYFDD